MNYKKIYNYIINNRIDNLLDNNTYTELHHIKPKYSSKNENEKFFGKKIDTLKRAKSQKSNNKWFNSYEELLIKRGYINVLS